MGSYNLNQREAVQADDAEICVIAGPGSGKTHILTGRIQTRVAAGVDPKRIAVMTFTNAGAGEFVKRLAPIVPGYAGTIHGFCLRLLQRFGHLIGYRKGGVTVNILPEKDRERMIEAARDALGLKKKITMKAVMSLQREARAGVCGPDTDEQDFRNATLVWRGYGESLKRNNMVDYDRLLGEGVRLLEMDAVASSLGIDELYCDEFQDSGDLDHRVVDLIRAKSKFLVGDSDQALYSWRGGDPQLFVARAHRAKCIWLEQNYRCGRLICEAATRVIFHNTTRSIQKRTVAADGFIIGFVGSGSFESDAEEIAFAAARFERRHGEHGIPYEEMAFLCRTNSIAGKARMLLAGYGIPTRKPAQVAPPLGWDLALLLVSLSVDPQNDVMAEALLVAQGRGNLVADFRREAAIQRVCLAERSSFVQCCMVSSVAQYLARAGVQVPAVDAIVNLILAQQPGTMADLLAAMLDPDAFISEPAKGGVEVLTVHGAKGREWDCVVVAGLEEGNFPSLRSDIEEERRLMFVAMTRAKNALYLTCATNRTGDKHWQNQRGLTPSRFLAEALTP